MLELPPKLQSAYCGAGNIARSRLSGGSAPDESQQPELAAPFLGG